MLRIASPEQKETRASAVRCSVAGEVKIGDADIWTKPLKLIESAASAKPLGGATSEETAYAYTGHQAAVELARRAGDSAGAERHAARLKKNRDNFNARLWLADRGHPAAYIEQTGLQRVHESYWLYGIFVPVESGLLDQIQAVLSLRHTEHELERVKMPYGGEQCWPSNWVPSVWSVRQIWPGDNYALAQAYFETGLTEKGWDLLRGTFPESLLYRVVPGDMGYPAGGTDFSDCASPFGRVVVRGLFGYRPDYPADRVTIAPQFPHQWDHASIRMPDCSIAFKRVGNVDRFEVALTHAAPIELSLPVHAKAIDSVRVNGVLMSPKVEPGFGHAIAKIEIPRTQGAVVVELAVKDCIAPAPAIEQTHEVGNALKLTSEQGKVVEWKDPQASLANAAIVDGAIAATAAKTAGQRTVLAKVRRGEL